MAQTPLTWLLLGVASLVIGLSKSGIPGLSVLVPPLFAGAFPSSASTGLVLPLLIVGDIAAVAFYRRHAVWRHVVKLFPFAAAGIVAGYFAMGRIPDSAFGPIVGVITLGMLAVDLWRRRVLGVEASIPTQWWFAAVFGLLAGFTTMVANAAGPIMFIYLLAMRLPRDEFLGTAAWYFFLLNVFKVPFSLALGFITVPSLGVNLRLAPIVIAGGVLGLLVAKRIPEKVFTAVVQVLAAVSALVLIF